MNDKIERALTNFEDKLGTVLVNFEDQINKLKTENELLKDENEKLHKACEMWMKEASKNNEIYYE